MPAINSRSERGSVQLAELSLLPRPFVGRRTPGPLAKRSNGAVSNRYSIVAGPGVRIHLSALSSHRKTLGIQLLLVREEGSFVPGFVPVTSAAAAPRRRSSVSPIRFCFRKRPELVAILAYNCIVTTALGYFLWGKVLSMMPAATAGQVLMLTPIGGFVLSTLIFGGAVTADVLLSVALIVGGIFVTLRR